MFQTDRDLRGACRATRSSLARNWTERIVRARFGNQDTDLETLMRDRAQELRDIAAQCISLARSARDPVARAGLIALARALHEMARRPPIDLDDLAEAGDQLRRH